MSARSCARARSCSPTCTWRPIAPQTKDLIDSGAVCIAYETVTAANGSLPLLTPMSEVAGRLAPQVGAHALEKAQGGRGVLLGGVPGVPAAEVVILGGGVSAPTRPRSPWAWARRSPWSTVRRMR
jgi:alanine dehydrogenase